MLLKNHSKPTFPNTQDKRHERKNEQKATREQRIRADIQQQRREDALPWNKAQDAGCGVQGKH